MTTMLKDKPASPGPSIAQEKAREGVADAKAAAVKRQGEVKAATPCCRVYYRLIDILNGTGLQTIMYLVFVVIFQTLGNTIRDPKEFYVDKHVMDRVCACRFTFHVTHVPGRL